MVDSSMSLGSHAVSESGFSQRFLRNNEIATDSPNKGSIVSVLEPDDDKSFDALMADVADSTSSFADRVSHQLSERGALLLRNFPLANTSQAEQLLAALGTQFDDEYLGGASPRSRLSDHFFSSTEAPSPYIISFHTEMCYLRQRPGKIFFYCITPPGKYGETPVFDCAQIFERLDAELRDKIETLGLIYQRYFGTRKKIFNVYKTWMDAFHTDDREAAEEACRKQGLSFEWDKDGGLTTQSKMPGIIVHPKTGQKCISLTLYNGEAAPYDMRSFASRLNFISRLALSLLVRSQYAKKNVFMRTLWGDGSAISVAETRTMIDAAWQSSNLFSWQQGDLMILDNIRCGHGRLNVVKPRKIAAALGDPYTVN